MYLISRLSKTYAHFENLQYRHFCSFLINIMAEEFSEPFDGSALLENI